MKKIDLHIHTVSSVLDPNFEFELDKLKEYVERMKLDIIAITNHNLFDLQQFQLIDQNIDIIVLPGVEISLEKGHALLISENKELEDFAVKCDQLNELVKSEKDTITLIQVKEIFSDLSKYILIPHYDKKPIVDDEIIDSLDSIITTGEVNSIKKFMYSVKDPDRLVPVIFSDIRISTDLNMNNLGARQTFLDLNEYSFNGLKLCLSDKNKVSLSQHEGHAYFQVMENGLFFSTGLNVILGERSSGKSYTLNQIHKNLENVKYIEQFSLLEKDEEKEKDKFNELLKTKQSYVTQEYLKEFKSVIDDVINIDLENDVSNIEKYLETLKKFATEQEKSDCFSKSKLFNESNFIENDIENLKKLISSATMLFENTEYRDIISKFITQESISQLLTELIIKHNVELEMNLKMRWLNELIDNVKKELVVRTASTQIKNVNFTDVVNNRIKISKFEEVASLVMKEREIVRKNVQGFDIVASTCKFTGAQELKNLSKRQTAFSTAYKVYEKPYEYLKELKLIDLLEDTEIYKYFVNINYKILNKDNYEVSGGERSEYNLLQQISDALEYDLLLIDEPESSFDNLFLKNDVNDLIKSISTKIPVIVVTHNNTIGASIKPDFVLYTKKVANETGINYKIFSGHPADKLLKSVYGETIENIEVIYNCLEAGKIAYTERGRTYEILEDKQ